MKNITLNPHKVALVTGGATGIGAGLVKALVSDGYRVYVMDRLPLEESPQVRAFYGDVADNAAREAFLDFVLSDVDAIDVIVHNAMRWFAGLNSKASIPDFEESLRIAAVAPYHFVLRLSDHFAPGACMVNLLSTRAFQSQADNESYAAAKGALSALTHALANSCGPKLRVNAIAPGWIDTQGAAHSAADHAQHSVGRVGQVDDIVAAMRYLISKEAGFVQGTTLVVDGGMSKRMIYHGDEGWTFTP